MSFTDPLTGAQVDPGTIPVMTPLGTGPLGSPEGDGLTWADPGTMPTPADAAIGGSQAAGAQDGSGVL